MDQKNWSKKSKIAKFEHLTNCKTPFDPIGYLVLICIIKENQLKKGLVNTVFYIGCWGPKSAA